MDMTRQELWTCGFCFARNDAEAMTNCCASAETCPLIWEKPGRNSRGDFVLDEETETERHDPTGPPR